MKRWLDSVDNAIEGILYASKTERHIRFHLYATAVLLVVCFTFGINKWEFIILTTMATIIVSAELFNSAIESMVDLLSPQKQESARLAKDIAAGAVLVPSFVSLVAAYFILKPYVIGFYTNGIRIAHHSGGDITVTAVIIVIIFVIIIKSIIGHGQSLRGGMPSGHSAIAFSLCVSVSLIHLNLTVFIIFLLLAVLTALSRVVQGVHSILEVTAGAVLGSAVTWLLFKVFY